MKKKLRKYIILPLLAVLWLCGCGKKEETDTETIYADRERDQVLADFLIDLLSDTGGILCGDALLL